MNELIESILKITNESNFGWLDIDSVEAKKIEELIKEFKNKQIWMYIQRYGFGLTQLFTYG